MDIVLLLISGLVGGFFAGMLGIGGGIIYIAVLPLALRHFGLENEVLVSAVIANSILATFFASLLSLHRHYIHNNLHVKESLAIGIPGAIALILSYRLVVEKGSYNFSYFNIFIILILLFMLLRQFFKKREIKVEERKGNPIFNSVIGASGGILSAFSGLGGGAIVVPMLISILKMDIKKATSVSMGFIFFASLGMSIYNLIFTSLDIKGSIGGVIILPIIAPLIVGVIIAAPFGVKLAKSISSKTLTIVFVFFILLVMVSRLIDLIR